MSSMCLKIMIATLCSLWALALMSAPVTMELSDGWRFRQGRLSNWYAATVPGTVHTDLMAAGKIEDPLQGLNERGVQWVDKEDWIYETTFDLPAHILQQSNIDIIFNGLDTYADVWLNDTKILSTDNMFRRWSADIKPVVKSRGNLLRVLFRSPIKEDIPKWDSVPFHYQAGNDQSQNGGVFDKKVSVFARKAGYHYGWDWGPRLVTSGIWRAVYIQGWSEAKIKQIEVRQSEVSRRSAKISAVVEVLSERNVPGAEVKVTDQASGKVLGSVKSNLSKGSNRITVDFTIKNPRLWWSNGLGEPHLYDLHTQLSIAGKIADSRVESVGIRSLKLVRKADAAGESFYFELNGVNVFAKGANWIPNDNFLPRVTKEIYARTVADAVAANMNMLRVWGGGVYEDDYFYDLCDRNGIMVWQDFMFACSLYPAAGDFLENIRQEAIDNVCRLRNHPCIALWCGNNENQVAWFAWGWKEEYEKQNPAWAAAIWKQYTDHYFVTLADVVAEYGSGAAYHPSSPFFSPADGQSEAAGDRHFWGVWHQKLPIATYNNVRSRFFSEYGFQSFPSFEAVKRYAPNPEDWSIDSDVMMSHQRGGAHANSLIETYLLNEYHVPRDFGEFLYMNHILQGDAIKTAIEAHRRDMPYCMGTLFWQINDCWPVASWSSRDYYGQWKAMHYFAREAFRDVLVSPVEREDTLRVYVVSDRLEPFSALLSVSVIGLDSTQAYHSVKQVVVAANSSVNLFTETLSVLLGAADRRDVVVHVELQADGAKYENNYFLCKQKDVRYPPARIERTIKTTQEGYEVTLHSDCFARGVYLWLDGTDYFFDNNYFDILPGQSVTVRVKTALSPDDFSAQLHVRSLTGV